MKFEIRSPELRANPYPIYRRLRAEAPICRTEPFDYWAVSRYQDVSAVLRNPKVFSSAVVREPVPDGPGLLLYGRTLIGDDPPDHGRLRGLLSRAFTPGMVIAQENQIREVTQTLLQKAASQEVFDFVGDFAAPLPIIVIARMMGIDADRHADFKRWSDLLLTWRNHKEASEVEREIAGMFDHFSEVIEERRARPKEDLISALVLACDEGAKLTAREVMGFVRLLLVAGNETTTNLIGNTMLALLNHPDVWKAVKADQSHIPKLIEESLRYDSPALALMRRANEDCEIGGVGIQKGEIVLALIASANHDEAMFSNAEQFELSRDAGKHLSFGAGIHYCMGSPLARLQARIAFEEVVATFGELSRVSGGPLEYLNSFFFRGAKALELAAG